MPTINITSVDPRQEAIDLAQQTISAIRNIPTDAPVYANQPTFSEFLKLIEQAKSDAYSLMNRTIQAFADSSIIIEFVNCDNQISFLRKYTGLTQVKFSEKYHISRRNIENWQGNKSKPAQSHVLLFAYAVFCEFH